MDLSNLVEFLQHEDTHWSSRGHHYINIPFSISSDEYLGFAEKDFKEEKDARRMVNALSNAKRSLDCRIDSLLIAFYYYELAKKNKWNIPKKFEIIGNLGILAPTVLRKINSVRNLMEHEFISPQQEQVSDFIDIVALFLASTEKYLYDFPDDCQIENDTLGDYWLDIDFKRDKNYIHVRVIFEDRSIKVEELRIDADTCLYSKFLKEYLRITTSYKTMQK
jgi:hypothetical protein